MRASATLDDNIRAALTLKNGLDKKLSSNASLVLNESIQFVPANKPFESSAVLLKAKYIHISSREQEADPASANPTKSVVVEGSLEKRKIKLNGFVPEPSTSSAYKECSNTDDYWGPEVPAPQFHIYPANQVRVLWDQSVRVATGVGLDNLGNTCFLNSVLQVLTNTAPLVNYLFSNDHEISCPKATGYCSLCQLRTHVRKVHSSAAQRNGYSIAPSAIVHNIKCVMKNHGYGRQEDAHEFLRYFVDSMQTASLYKYRDKKLDLFTKETSAIGRIFGGFHKSEIVCNNCHSISTTFDPFLDLSLEIKQFSNVEGALQHFTRVETLSNENAYKCPKCNLKFSAKKMFTIYHPPNILTIQLKRFDHFGKIDKHVTFNETMNIRRFMSEKQGPAVNYKLYGVIVHTGRTTSSGHYFAFVRNPFDQWHLMDDSRVCPVKSEIVLRSTAYVLFYVRTKPKAVASVNPSPSPSRPFATVEVIQSPSTPKVNGFSTNTFKRPAEVVSSLSSNVNGFTTNSFKRTAVEDASPATQKSNVLAPNTFKKPSAEEVVKRPAAEEVVKRPAAEEVLKRPVAEEVSTTPKLNGHSSAQVNQPAIISSPLAKTPGNKIVFHLNPKKTINIITKPIVSKVENNLNGQRHKLMDEKVKANQSTAHQRQKLMSPLEFLKSHCGSGFGSSVKTWSGETNSIDRTTKKDDDRKRNRADEWNEELDRGKEKRIKLHHDHHSHNKFRMNQFQKIQNKNYRKGSINNY